MMISRSPRNSLIAVAAFLLAVLAIVPTSANAQIRASERGQVTQTIDGTTITIDYSRPRMRLRGVEDIFGGEVHWGEVWTPGANSGTKLTVDKDVTINGQAVSAGSYSVWLVVVEGDSWLTGLHPDTTLFHTAHPEVTDAMIQFQSPAKVSSKTEDLRWSFDGITSTGVTAKMQWSDRSVDFKVKVEPSLPIELAAEKAAPFVGTYSVSWANGPTPDGFGETAELFHANEALRMRWDIWFWPEMKEQILVPLTDEWFTFGIAIDGEMFDVIRQFTYEFTMENGKATGFDVRLPNDMVLFSGKRK